MKILRNPYEIFIMKKVICVYSLVQTAFHSDQLCSGFMSHPVPTVCRTPLNIPDWPENFGSVDRYPKVRQNGVAGSCEACAYEMCYRGRAAEGLNSMPKSVQAGCMPAMLQG